jgi:pyruvate/2-oxoglutarate dehydrogenase complex dihydrolipoamide acyltransferase (E2) component
MSKVEFTYLKGGKKVLMARRYAETLRKLGHGTFPDEGYQTRMLAAGAPAKAAQAEDEPRASEAVVKFAEENGVDLDKVVGTGLNGRIKKADVEAAISAQDLA